MAWWKFTFQIAFAPEDRRRFDRLLDLLESGSQEGPGNAVSGSAAFTKLDGEKIMARGVISNDQTSIVLDLMYFDKKGRPGALIFGTPTIALSRDDMVDAVADVSDPKKPFVTFTLKDDAPVGSVHAVVTAQGEETEGEQPILIEADVDVVAADAERGEGVFREPT